MQILKKLNSFLDKSFVQLALVFDLKQGIGHTKQEQQEQQIYENNLLKRGKTHIKSFYFVCLGL